MDCVRLGDVDGDKDGDIVACDDFGRFYLLLNDGTGVFSDVSKKTLPLLKLQYTPAFLLVDRLIGGRPRI